MPTAAMIEINFTYFILSAEITNLTPIKITSCEALKPNKIINMYLLSESFEF